MAEDAESNGADVDLELGGQKVKLKNVKSLNTLATVATLILVCVLGYAFWEHKVDAKADGLARDSALTSAFKEIASSQKDMAQAVREGNCLNSFKEAERELKVEHCRRITR